MQDTFEELLDGADNATVRRYVQAYIMILLGTQLFGDKSDTRLHIRWLPYVARLEDMGGPIGYDTFGCPLASRSQPDREREKILSCSLKAHDRSPTGWGFQVVYIEILEPQHTALWKSVTVLIYFSIIEWHQVDRVLPQFGGVQPRSWAALVIDFLMSKDGRGGDRAVPIPFEATQRGPGRVPDMDRVDDVPDRRDEGRGRGRGRGRGHAGQAGRSGRRVRARDRGRGRHDDYGSDDDGDGGDDGGHHGGDGGGMWVDLEEVNMVAVIEDHMVETGMVLVDDQDVHESQTYISSSQLLSDLLTNEGLDAEFGGSHFLEEISVIMQEDKAARQRSHATGPQILPDVDLNEPLSGTLHEHFALGGTPPSAYKVFPQTVAGPSRPPPQTAHEAAGDGDEDEVPLA
ncbi:hypothetical protein Ahy_A02g006829 [Arachis hypogaea]|uniref:Aminotransferase-like plant mobile domain-containing protein n=1 Tax=Arachis hypogaea TaxID=3818 RepID=A0A445EBD3_ARAHY|nr:hypothetical protein Ahy_A02g006829 [Arachis hypogaea]